MSAIFDDARASVMRFMDEEGYTKSYKSEVRSALRNLGRFLDAAGAEFSDALASEWLEAELAPRGHIRRGVGRIAVKRVRDALANGRVTSGRLRDEKPAYDRLPGWAREVVDGFVGTTGDPVDARATARGSSSSPSKTAPTARRASVRSTLPSGSTPWPTSTPA